MLSWACLDVGFTAMHLETTHMLEVFPSLWRLFLSSLPLLLPGELLVGPSFEMPLPYVCPLLPSFLAACRPCSTKTLQHEDLPCMGTTAFHLLSRRLWLHFLWLEICSHLILLIRGRQGPPSLPFKI